MPAKQILPHMYVISNSPVGGYLVTLGDPQHESSRLMRSPPTKADMTDWVRQNVGRGISDNHVIDLTAEFGISPVWSEFYLQSCTATGAAR
jgi:hypothetical protein